MPRLSWNTPGTRLFETGLDRGVLYPRDGTGVPWNGLISVEEESSGGEAQAYYQDGIKQQNSAGAEDFEASIKALTYPPEFAECDGTISFGKGLSIDKQPRKPFDLCYRTLIGNDLEGEDHGYTLHVVYNALVAPTKKNYQTGGDEIEPSEFSWKISTTPVVISGRKASAHFKIDSTKTDPYLLAAFEELIYGSGSAYPTLPTATQLVTLFETWQTVVVVDNGDGTWTASGPDPVINFLSESEFTIDWHTANYIDGNAYTLGLNRRVIPGDSLIEDPTDLGTFLVRGTIEEYPDDPGLYTTA